MRDVCAPLSLMGRRDCVVADQSVRFSPDVERTDPGFEHHFKTVLENMRRHTEQSVEVEVEVEGIGIAVRDAHAKGFGLARGEVEILKGLPDAYAQGVYAKPGRHEAMVRFSNGTAHTGADKFLPAGCGIGLKILDIDGPTFLEDEPDTRTFDYAMINAPTFFVNTIEDYLFIQHLFLQVRKVPPANETPEEKRARLYRFLHDWVTGEGRLPPEEWALRVRHPGPVVHRFGPHAPGTEESRGGLRPMNEQDNRAFRQTPDVVPQDFD